MQAQFIAAWAKARQQALELGVRMRPVEPEQAMTTAQ